MSKKPSKDRLKELQESFRIELLKIAKYLSKHPMDVTSAEYKANRSSSVTDWELRMAGGFSGLKKLFFYEEPVDAKTQQASKSITAFKKKLEREFGQEAFLTEEMVNALKDYLKANPPKLHKPVKPSKSKKKLERTLIAHFSDLHYGCVVDSKEMGGVNNWNWTVAARRTAGLVESIANYKRHYRDETELVVGLNGDIIAGVIHNQEWFAEPIATQVGGTLDVLSQALSYLAQNFKKVRVYCTTGNHGRTVHKMEKGRSSVHKWDSFETIIYRGLEMYLRAYKNVEVHIPETPYALFHAQGHQFFMTHGDTVFNVGMPGKALNMKKIDDQITRLNANLLNEGEELAGVLVGHVHTPTMQLTDSGATLFVNGCLIGNDPFAQSIGLHRSQPAQWLFEVTKADAVGDQRLIKLARHDSDKALEKIVKPFKGKY